MKHINSFKTRQDEMEEQALQYHTNNPEVWDKYQGFAFDRIRRGYKHFSSSAIIQRIRWDTGVGRKGEGDFKIPNAHAAHYARWFMNKYPEHDGFFRTCLQKSRTIPANGE